ncbi:hypothetical protein [Actinomycetospora sp. TBRC 11914]|uniref:hypothetical protein n=1 Tax=Actinomycetospora sp. TBRC 11914 TaxID=2729387 RepID=UPI00145C55BE|nr:hypothetical protein [Actinomycetospora sp. TBRC 11914]NMO89513.1 hypothetical protein [Actinomycetospora sp. TBRC 11914]
MSENSSDRRFDTRLFLGGAVLTALGSLLATLGVALGSVAVVQAGRRWQQGTEMTPAQLARHALGSAQAATTAGAQAWRAPRDGARLGVASPDGRPQPVP